MRLQTAPNDVSHFIVPLFGAHSVAFLSCMLTASLLMHWQSLVLDLAAAWNLLRDLLDRHFPVLRTQEDFGRVLQQKHGHCSVASVF